MPDPVLRFGGKLLVNGLFPVDEQQLVNVYLNGAHFRTLSAEGGCIAQVLELVHSFKKRRNDGPDRAGISGVVGVAANGLVNRAGIQTGSAADTGKRASLLCFLQ